MTPSRRKEPAGASPRLLRRFRREVTALTRLDHPGLPRLIDTGVGAAGRPFVLYREVPGETLRAALVKGPVTAIAWVAAADSLLGLLEYLHDGPPALAHGDISARNVLIDGDGGCGLVDFGISRSLDRSIPSDDADACAAPRYLSPEQAARRPWAAPSDCFQAGLVLAEMRLGRPLNPGRTPAEALRVMREKPDCAGEVAARLTRDRDVFRLLTGLLAPDPRHRLSAAEARRLLAASASMSGQPAGGGQIHDPSRRPGRKPSPPLLQPRPAAGDA